MPQFQLPCRGSEIASPTVVDTFLQVSVFSLPDDIRLLFLNSAYSIFLGRVLNYLVNNSFLDLKVSQLGLVLIISEKF